MSTAFNFLIIISDAAILTTRHVWDIPLTKAPALLKTLMAAELFYGLSSTLVKSSLLAMLRRFLANSSQKLLLRFILVFDVINLAAGITWIFAEIFQCR